MLITSVMGSLPFAITGIVSLLFPSNNSPFEAEQVNLVRDHHELVFDASSERLVLFGGNSRGSDNEYTYATDTWTLSDQGWTQLAKEGPGPRSSFAMAYDVARQRTIVLGGYSEGRALDDTWTFDGEQWAEVKTEGPGGRMSPGLCFDPVSEQVLLFGGLANGLYGDTWGWNGEKWTQLAEDGPPGRSRMAIFHDAVRKSVVIHGGYVRASGQGRSAADMWEWTDEKWSPVDQGKVTPPPLNNHRGAYDEQREVAVVFGGSTERGVYLDATWEWDGAKWTHRTPESRPPARGNFAMTYDAKLEQIVIQGGKASSGKTLSDAWAWDGEDWNPLPAP